MSNNYYWDVPTIYLPTGVRLIYNDDDPTVHIGKSYKGKGGRTFIWCQHKEVVMRICEANLHNIVIRDEAYNMLSGRDFITFIDECIVAHEEHIGRYFC